MTRLSHPRWSTAVNVPITRSRRRGILRTLYLYVGISLVPWLISPIPALAETRAYIPAMILGHEGQEEGLFRQPSGIVADDAGRLYVADSYNHRIQVFEADGRFVQVFGTPGVRLGMLWRPSGRRRIST